MTVLEPPSPQVDLPDTDSTIDAAETSPANLESDPFAESIAKLQFVLSLLQIFAVSLLVRLCFNFATTHTNCSFVGDASEYLREATALATPVFHTPDFLRHAFELLTGKATPAVLQQIHQQTTVLSELKVAGPVFPLFLLSCFALSGQTPGVEHWQVPVIVQCLISSCTCVLIALTASRVWNRSTGIAAGAIATIYPSFVLSTGSLYTETFTAFLCTCIAFISVTSLMSRPVGNLACVFLGFFSAALQLTRPPAVIVSLLTFPFVLWQRRSRKPLVAIMSLIAGFALICAPYLVFQKVAFNTASLIVNRRATENLFMGNSNFTQGWIAMPFTWMPPENERTSYIVKRALSNPRQSLQLMIDKFIRLTKFPYNDYRVQLGPFNFPRQVLFHQLIMLFAAVGVALTLFTVPTRSSENRNSRTPYTSTQAKICLLMLIGSNLVYVAFVAMARYFYPSMPIVIMFAAAGIVSLSTCLRYKSYPLILSTIAAITAVLISAQLNFSPLLLKTGIVSNIMWAQTADFTIRLIPVICLACIIAILIGSTTRGYRRAGYVCTGLLLLLLIPAVCLPSRANGRSLETTFILNRPEQVLRQEILLPPSVGPAYLMLDLDGIKSLNGLTVSINGVEITPRFIPSLAVIATSPMHRHLQGNSFYLEIENLFHCLALPSRISSDDLRQWFLLPLPSSITGYTEESKMETKESEIAAGGSRVQARRSGPLKKLEIELKKTNFATTTIYGEFARNKYDLVIPSISSQSSEKAFCCVESPATFGDPRFDARVKLLQTSSEGQSATDGQIANGEPHDATGRADSKNGEESLKASVRAVPNIRLLSTPEGNAIGTTESTVKLPDQQVDSARQSMVSISPAFPTGAQIMLLRFHGSVKTLQGNPAPHIALQAFSGKDGAITGYDSPWLPSRLLTADSWQQFEFTVPLAVAELPGSVKALNILITDGDPQQQLLRKQHSHSSFAVKDFAVETSPLTSRPLEPGFCIY